MIKKINFVKGGRKNSGYTARVSIPIDMIKKIGISKDDPEVEISLIGNQIIVEKGEKTMYAEFYKMVEEKIDEIVDAISEKAAPYTSAALIVNKRDELTREFFDLVDSLIDKKKEDIISDIADEDERYNKIEELYELTTSEFFDEILSEDERRDFAGIFHEYYEEKMREAKEGE